MKRIKCKSRGMTLIELLLALAGTAMVSAAIAAMLMATSYGTSSRTDLRELVVKHKATAGRLSAAVRSARQVLAQGDGYLVLWMADSNSDGMVNLSELRRIERDSASNEIRSYVAPLDLAEASDTSYDPSSTNFDTTTNAIKGTANFPKALWATNVTDWTVAVNDSDLTVARLVTWRVTFQAGDLTDTSVDAAALRNQ